MIKVSVVMSAYNSEKFLVEALESILGQSYKAFELIIFDDGSADGTRDIIEQYAMKDKRVVPVFNEENLGLTANLNRGIRLSQGTYIGRMDADDIALPRRFEKQVAYLDTNPHIDLVGTAAIDIDEMGKKIQLRISPELHEEIIALLPKANPLIHSTVMFRKDRFSAIGFYDESFRTTQDYEMWFRAVGKGLRLHNLQEVLLLYRMDDNYHKRKSLNYRLYDCKLRLQSFKYLKLPIYKYYYAMIPIILGLLPETLYGSVKKFDPRVNELD